MVAELPQFLRRARVLEDDLIDLEGREVASSVAIDGICDMLDELAQLSVVVLADHRARGLSLRLAGHDSEATHVTDPALVAVATACDQAHCGMSGR
jgi:hypothetical protein